MWPNKKYMSLERGIIHGGCYWFVDINSNVLCSYNLKTRTLHYIIDLSEYHNEYYTTRLYSLATIYQNRAILFPVFGNNLLDVDLNTLKVFKFSVDIPNNDDTFSDGNSIKFRNAIKIKSKIWIIPLACKYLLSYDLEKRTLHSMTDWYRPLEKYNWNKQVIFGIGVYNNGSIWLPSYHTNILVEVKLSSMSTQLYHVNREDNIFSVISSIGDKFWLLDNKKNEICIWSKENGVEDILDKFPDGYGLENKYIGLNIDYERDNIESAKVLGDYIVYLPGFANKYLLVNTITKEIETLDGKPVGAYHVYADYINNNAIILGSQESSELMIIDISKKEVFKLLSFYDKIEGFPAEKITIENNNINLLDYIDYIINN